MFPIVRAALLRQTRGKDAEEFVFVEEFWQKDARNRLSLGAGFFALEAIAQRLAEHGFGVGHAREIEDFPGAMGEDDAVDVSVVVDDVEEIVEGVLG